MRRAVALAAACVVAALLAAPAQAAPKRFFGVVTQGLFTEAEYELMEDAGVGTLRLQLLWPVVQQEEGRCQAGAQTGVCNWAGYDDLIGDAAAHGIEAIPYALNVPGFISENRDTPPVRSQEARKAWKAFIQAAVKRYGRGGTYWESVYPLEHPLADPVPIRRWQVWNEPSAQPFWHPKPKPREYAKLVKLTSKQITRVDRKAYVILGGLFGTPTVGIDQPKFIRALYRVPKIERFFDAVAIHPYGPDLKRVRFQVRWALEEIRRARDRKAELWISEIGWASDRVHNQLGVGRKGQARMLRKSFRMFERKRRGWDLGGVNWYAWQDTDQDGFCDFCRRSGLVDVDLQPKPSYDEFRALAG